MRSPMSFWKNCMVFPFVYDLIITGLKGEGNKLEYINGYEYLTNSNEIKVNQLWGKDIQRDREGD